MGLIPKRRGEIARSIAETVESELISHEDIQRVVERPEFQTEAARIIEEQIEKFLREKLGTNPIFAAFLQGEAANMIRAMFVDQIASSIPEVLSGLMNKMEEHLDFRQLVQEKIEAFDLDRLESVIFKIARRELKTIEYLGGVLGFIVGIAQVAILHLAQVL
jgi:uncharacterized membrane protein YheB (UPF0754 family)